jgi:hypothetical protein
MHPRTEQLLRQLDEHRAALRAAVEAVPATRRETRAVADRWSVAEVLEHLTRVEEQITRLLASKLSEAQLTGTLEPEPETGPLTDNIDRDRILDRSRRITAGERVLPRGGMDAAAALAALEKTRANLRDLVITYDGMAIGAVAHPHPVLGIINGYQWVDFIGIHEARHTAQIRELAR